jgi:aminopeptidase N
MIKWILGDEQFYAMLKAYQNNPAFAYNYVKTNDFRDFIILHRKNFTEFFNDWIYGEGYPIYQIRWTQDPTSKKLTFRVGQTRSSSSVSFFEMPLPIKVSDLGDKPLILFWIILPTINISHKMSILMLQCNL